MLWVLLINSDLTILLVLHVFAYYKSFSLPFAKNLIRFGVPYLIAVQLYAGTFLKTF